jgi:hypothetical protein
LVSSYGVATNGARTVFYALFMAIAAVLVMGIYATNDLNSIVLWGFAAWGLAHMMGGLVEIDGRVIYERALLGGEFRFDKIVHFIGFGFATAASYELVRQNLGRDAPVRPVAIAAAFIGLGIGAVNETR